MLPGVVVALAWQPMPLGELWWRLLVGLLACGLVASSNYTLNELIDGPYDLHHPTKKSRPVPSGAVSVPLALVQWIALGAIGLGLGYAINIQFVYTLASLWVMGCVYNIPPVRSKDVPYLDVLTEAVNNPIRMLAGWFIVTSTALPPASLLLCYWMVGCYLMAIKRFAEFRHLGDRARVAEYRRSLAYFTEDRLIVAILFYGSAGMLFFGAFIMRYRLELIATFPLVALVMARYLALGFEEDSAAQHPEKLYREPTLMAAVIATVIAMGVLTFVDVPILHRIFSPSIPPR